MSYPPALHHPGSPISQIPYQIQVAKCVLSQVTSCTPDVSSWVTETRPLTLALLARTRCVTSTWCTTWMQLNSGEYLTVPTMTLQYLLVPWVPIIPVPEQVTVYCRKYPLNIQRHELDYQWPVKRFSFRDTEIYGLRCYDVSIFYMAFNFLWLSRLEDGCYFEKKFIVPEYARPKEEETESVEFKLDDTWNSTDIVKNQGQIGGLSHSADNKNLVIFHRAGTDSFQHLFAQNTHSTHNSHIFQVVQLHGLFYSASIYLQSKKSRVWPKLKVLLCIQSLTPAIELTIIESEHMKNIAYQYVFLFIFRLPTSTYHYF